jgi:hypothetical protein
VPTSHLMTEEEEFIWAVKSEGHLVTRNAGGSAREQAKELRDAQPVRTRLARLLKVNTDERAYRVGAEGEETVGRRLARLDPSRWLVLHDIVLNDKGTNLDHLVIGPTGVFSLNTKHHPKAKVIVTERSFRLNGYREAYLPIAVNEAAKVARVLETAVGYPVQVRPVIVVMGAELEVRSAPTDVSVIGRRDVPKWFLRLPVVLPDPQAKELKRVAGRPSTWNPSLAVTKPSLKVGKWSRYGKRRLYVNDSAGKALGYQDELTGHIHVDDARDFDRVKGALESWRAKDA